MEPNLTPELIPSDAERKRLILVLAGSLVIIVIIGIILAVTRSDTPKNTTMPVTPVFKNLLTPASELKVGTHRYVSPCQVLPLAEVSTIFGKTNGSSKVSEDTISASVPASEDSEDPQPACTYKLADDTLDLVTEQHIDAADVKRVSSTFSGVDSDVAEKVAILKKAGAGSADEDTKAFLSRINSSVAKFTTYKDVYDSDELAKVNVDGMILPNFLGDLILVQGNVTYSLHSDKALKDFKATDLAKYNRLFDVIIKNAKNPKLGQSPINTIIGKANSIGATKILEPCTIIDSATFSAISGHAENDLTRRVTLPIEANKDTIDSKVNKRVLLSNVCERQFSDDAAGKDVRLTLYQGKTVAYAQQYMKDFDDTPNDTPPSPLQTTADEALYFPPTIDPDVSLYLFRVGPYVGLLDISDVTKPSGGGLTITNASQDQYVSAINLLTARIKAQQ